MKRRMERLESVYFGLQDGAHDLYVLVFRAGISETSLAAAFLAEVARVQRRIRFRP